jgi:ketosteroid isomerase-like protein
MGLKGADEGLTREIQEREMRIWDAYRRGDIAAHNALLSDHYRAVHPDGSIHGKPTSQQFASEPMSAFRFSDFLAEPLGESFALVSYIADVDGPGPGGKQLHVRFVVGEVWAREAGEWKVRQYQPTVVTPAWK